MNRLRALRLAPLPARSARLVAARSYATPVEFKQIPHDTQLGDYPQLPAESPQRRPAKGWWDIQDRRNFGETVHEQAEALSMWSPDVSTISRSNAAFQIGVAILGFVAFGLTVRAITPDRPAVPRSYPRDGLVEELGGLDENKAISDSEQSEE
ncbi:hypothetical protein BOTBODRAFT_44717 [Botryobasidium botryosum FD-172 SS1]|uniref:Uncharacterized protein n=1 Tax=Botryobasidium botryosum (strain FD-172 SS1) TaxID=930990 RepID=A0A067MF26_BOTB1|nr:hypothetical protein BOTBODRAFT_44717 [Botryobasidium botryosum FD-172 SS1]